MTYVANNIIKYHSQPNFCFTLMIKYCFPLTFLDQYLFSYKNLTEPYSKLKSTCFLFL